LSDSEDEVLSDNAIIEKFSDFISSFSSIPGAAYPYFEKIQALLYREDKTITVNHTDLPPELLCFFFGSSSRDVEYNLKLLSQAVQNAYREYYPDDPNWERVEAKLSIDDRKLLTNMREINISHRNRLIVFDSTIVSKSERKSTFYLKVFKCSVCGQLYPRKQARCDNGDACGAKTVNISITDSKLTDCEYMECQERQEDLVNNATIPTAIDVKVYGSLVGKFKPGDNVRVTGIVKIQKTVTDAVLNRSDDEEFSSDLLFDTVVEAHNIQLLSSSQQNLIVANPANHLSDDDITQILKLRRKYPNDNDLMAVLVNSFASHIYGHDRIKEAILLQSVGSVDMALEEGVKNRGKINIFLVGDPGVTKTRLLQAAARISINGQMASGKGASGVGLTASVESDGGNRGVKKLRIGAAVLAHNGHLSIDEYSNIHEEDRAYLLDCMESGTFRVNKGGINAVLNADASFLVATNPDSGKYNRFNTLFENVTISDQLFSRFHITFVMPDVVNRELDEKIAMHIMASYDNSILKRYADKLKTSDIKARIGNDLLIKYLLYAKTTNTGNIQISGEAMEVFMAFYHEIRTPEKAADITATPRQLEGMLKLGIARCRTMLRSTVTGDDAARTVEALSYAYHTAGMITSTGSMNQTAEYSKPLEKLKPVQALRLVMLNLTKDNTVPVRKETVILELVDRAKMETSQAYEVFNREYDNNKLLQNERREFLLMDRYE
jgi:replicative DNA helicase Mcm